MGERINKRTVVLTACEGPGEKVRFEHSATEPGLGKGSENISRPDDA